MSTGPSPIEEMDRDELEAELADLRDRVEQLEQVETVVTKLVNQLNDTDGDDGFVTTLDREQFVPEGVSAVERLAGMVQDHDDAIQRHESVISDSRSAACDVSEHWWHVVEAAHNLAGSPGHGLTDNRVKLYKENIAQATGLSEKRGQQLIDEWTDGGDKAKRGTEFCPYKVGSPGNNNERQRKALIIDLDVWEVPE